MPIPTETLEEIVTEAAGLAGIDGSEPRLLRNGSNAMFRLPGAVIARVAPAGRATIAEREVRVARWLAAEGLAVTTPLPGVPQPTLVGERPVTWWAALPPHRPGTPRELGAVLHDVHALPPPSFALPRHDPFHGISTRIHETRALSDDERGWLSRHLARLREEFAQQAPFRPPRLLHGDAWQGNLAVVDDSPPILLDFENVSLGDAAWDLVQIAVDHTDFARISHDEYADFVGSYGDDVFAWPAYPLAAAVQELRWVAFALSKADEPLAIPEIRHRVACIRGAVPKPWTWTAF
ncbi:phosphotransferase family protein [Pseudonocardia kunmingensis]|uniref:Ser/Thr protein kinase RdoA (MazF antagonist) n=1 Tax=Pseudonocardia kunmingensis TaxID=630975 RepID=A0A543DZX1_9PSEU|nr:aminoglycoside phosphotransferase family protein [Pseudonocardia kunmingensis]TQM14789.1 Ser/Thr protein kinase RdoA (MazF antagonist) [Pseudonocardia kunmingensis]